MMSEFYKIATVSFDDLKYSYNETTDPANYSNTGPKCPICNVPIGPLDWLKPRMVVLSKAAYGDFVYGNNLLLSERFKAAYEKSDLKGVVKFLPVEIAKIRYLSQHSQTPPCYYAVDLLYSFARVDIRKSKIKGQRRKGGCSLCNPFGKTIDEVEGIYINDANWEGEDIFHLHEMGGSVFGSQKFVDFCIENAFTNFKYENTKIYSTVSL